MKPSSAGQGIRGASSASRILKIAGIRVRHIERQLVRVFADTTIEFERIRQISDAAESAIEWNKRAVAQTNRLATGDRDHWELHVNPVLEELRNARLIDDRRSQIGAAARLTRLYNTHIPWSSFEEFDQLAHGKRELPAPTPGKTEPTDVEQIKLGAAALLGSVSHPPLQSITDPAVIALNTLYCDIGAEPTYRGAHVRAPRTGFWHHGVITGGNSVTHFTGEPPRVKDAEVKTDEWLAFAKSSTSFDFVEPKQFCREPITRLRRQIAVLNSHWAVGQNGYALFCNNCEHFAIRMQLGAGFSSQARFPHLNLGQIRRVRAKLAFPDAVTDDVLSCEIYPAKEYDLESALQDDAFLNIGHAYVDSLSGEVAVHLPLFQTDELSSPPAGLDESWSNHECKQWFGRPPVGSLYLDESQPFAALIWSPDLGAMWVTNEGEFRAPRFNLEKVVDDRLRPHRKRLNAYFYPGVLGELMQRGGSGFAKLGNLWPEQSKPTA